MAEKDLNALIKQLVDALKNVSGDTTGEQVKKEAESLLINENLAKILQDQEHSSEQINKNIDLVKKNSKETVDAEQIINELKDERIRKITEEFRLNQTILLQLRKQLEDAENASIKDTKAINDLKSKISLLEDATRKQGKIIEDSKKEQEIKEKILAIGKEIFQLTKQYGSELEKHIIQISTLNGGYDKYKETIGEANKLLYASTVGTGIMFEEANRSIQQLSTNFIGLSTQSAESIKQMSLGVAQLGKLGVDAATASRGFDSLVNAMGKTPAQAYKIQESFVQMAAKNRLALGSVTQAFAENSSRFVGYGAQMTKVLDGLAEQSLKTGIAIGKLVGIAQGFDTFEDASRKVGNLNALLGGDYFNTIELLTASDEERIRLIKEGVAASGMQFESMNRLEKMAIANAAGISDLNEASKLFGQTSLQNTRQQAEGAEVQKTLAEQAQSATLAMDKLKSSFNGLLIILEPIVTTFMKVVNVVANAVQEFKGFLEKVGLGTTAAAALTSALLAIPVVFPVLIAGFIAVAMAVSGFAASIVSSLLPIGSFGPVVAGAIEKVGLAATKGSIGLLALGAAIGLAAAGIGILIYGFADLTKYLAPLVDTFFNGINDALKSLISINPVSLYNIAAGLVAMAGGFAAITAASMGNVVVGGISAIAGVFSKKPTSVFEMLATLSEITNKFPVDGLQKIVSSILSFGNISNINVGSISSLVSELSNVDIDPINKLAEAIGTLGANLTMLASLSATGIKVEGTATNVVDTTMTAAAVSTINATNSAVKSQALIPAQQTTTYVPLVVQIDKKTIIEILKEDIKNISKGQALDTIDAVGLAQQAFYSIDRTST